MLDNDIKDGCFENTDHRIDILVQKLRQDMNRKTVNNQTFIAVLNNQKELRALLKKLQTDAPGSLTQQTKDENDALKAKVAQLTLDNIQLSNNMKSMSDQVAERAKQASDLGQRKVMETANEELNRVRTENKDLILAKQASDLGQRKVMETANEELNRVRTENKDLILEIDNLATENKLFMETANEELNRVRTENKDLILKIYNLANENKLMK